MVPWIFVPACLAAIASHPIYVAVTVDDLPGNGQELQAIRQALSDYEVPEPTGFVNGVLLEYDRDGMTWLRDWVKAGNLLGNHTYSHMHLEAELASLYTADIDRNEPILRQATGDNTSWRVFRYPYLEQGATQGQRNDVRNHLANAAYQVAEVTIDPYDWAWDRTYQRCLDQKDTAMAEQVHRGFIEDALAQLEWADYAATEIFGRSINHILLVHSRGLTATYLDELLEAFTEQGVEFVSLATALADPAYRVDVGNLQPSRGNYLNKVIHSQRIRNIPRPAPHPVAWMASQCLAAETDWQQE